VSAIVLVPMVMRGGIIERWEGFVLLAAYATYLAYLVADATDHGSKDLIGPAAVISVPLVLVTLVVLALRGRRIRTEDSAAA
jgi:membrane protein DedA with SNARE-associated domain